MIYLILKILWLGFWFGILANYTNQDFSGGSEVDYFGRGLTVLGDVCIPEAYRLEDAYNFTLFYEKNGLSARMRYTWRDAFRIHDSGGGANSGKCYF